MTAPAPLTSTTFVDGEEVTSSKLYTRVFTVINYLLGASATTTQNRFFGSILTATAITGGANIDFTGKIVEDTANAWNSTNKNWVCPSAGTYNYFIQTKCNATPSTPVVQLLKNGTVYAYGPNPSNIAFAGTNIGGYVRLAVGDTIAMRSLNTYTTQSDTPSHNNYLQMWQTSFG